MSPLMINSLDYPFNDQPRTSPLEGSTPTHMCSGGGVFSILENTSRANSAQKSAELAHPPQGGMRYSYHHTP